MTAQDPLTLRLPFYLSGPAPCPYLQGQVERKLFVRLQGDALSRQALNSLLTRRGFRRSHDIVYRPACPACQACVPVRIPVADFTPSTSQRRLLRRTAGWSVELLPAQLQPEQFALFRTYQAARHADSDMADMGPLDFAAMLQEGGEAARLLVVRDRAGKLAGCLLADLLEDGWSAVYAWFDPAQPLSLGTLLVLRLIEQARAAGLAHIYLGYWVQDSRKMNYKTRFRPLQALGPNGWSLREA